MPGYTSGDDLLNEMTANGKYKRVEISKTLAPAHTATAGWHLLNALNGYPNAQSFQSAVDLVQIQCTEQGGDGMATPTYPGPQHGGAVSTDKKFLTNWGANIIAAAGAPWQVKVVDLVAYYRMSTTNVTGTGSRALINSNTVTASSSAGLLLTYTNDFANYSKVRFTTTTTLPTGLSLATDYWIVRVSATTCRVATSLANAIAGTVVAYTDAGTGTHTMTLVNPRYADGVGCQAAFVSVTAPATGGPTLSASSYTNTAGTSSRAFQGTPTMNAAADAYATRILHSSNAANRYGPWLPLQGADTGIKSIESFTWSAGTAYTGTGVVALCIMKPLADLVIPASGMYSERDLINQLPSGVEIPDGACIGFMVYSTGATTANAPFTANLDFGWG